MGTLYVVDNGIGKFIDQLKSLGDWYDFMGSLTLEDADHCEIEDSWPLWRLATENCDKPLCYLFVGERNAEPVDSGDPSVGFISAENVAKISKLFCENEKEYFSKLLDSTGFSSENDMWLFEELNKFYSACSKNGKAILLLLS